MKGDLFQPSELDPFAGIAVYVDTLRPCVRNGQWRWDKASHLFVAPGEDIELSLRALHDAASTLGLKREWFQNRPNFPHYDLNPARHAVAVRVPVAIPVSIKKTMEVLNEWRVAIAAGRYSPTEWVAPQKLTIDHFHK